MQILQHFLRTTAVRRSSWKPSRHDARPTIFITYYCTFSDLIYYFIQEYRFIRSNMTKAGFDKMNNNQ